MALPEAAARQDQRQDDTGRRHRRRAADEDAAPPAEDPALHPRHGAGRARLFPDAAVLAGRLASENIAQPGALPGATAMPTARARPARRWPSRSAPVEYPEVGVYHPRMARRRSADGMRPMRCRAWPPAASAARSACCVMRSYLLAGNTGHYDGVITALEARGLRVIPAFATGLDARPAIERSSSTDGRTAIDALVSLTGFSLVGGPAYNDAKAAEDMLARLDVPYLAAHAGGVPDAGPVGRLRARPAAGRSDHDGRHPRARRRHRPDGLRRPRRRSRRACTGCDARLHLRAAPSAHDMHTCTERADMLAARVGKLVDLRRSERAERKVAAVHLQLPAQRRQHRHRRLPVGVRVAATTR